MVKLTIDGQTVEVEKNTTILEAARALHIKIPTLCYHPDQGVKANCRICVVEVEGERVLVPSCAFPVREGMVVKTTSPRVRRARKNILELIFAHHSKECLSCDKSGTCELQNIARELHFDYEIRYPTGVREAAKDISSPSIVRNHSKCINCNRCITVCNEVQTVSALARERRGFETVVTPAYGKKLAETVCINCGQCVQMCPVGALVVHDDRDK
ncbi:MAG: 2Fe-2S iron-sulfur cluster-binding protein, partial [Clostridiales bacterium]